MPHKSHEVLEAELEEAGKLVKVGGTYFHFRSPEKLYKVIGLAIQESSESVCVIYQAEYNKKLVFVRDLDAWLKQPEDNVERFQLVK
jgi:hypothetical protein